MSDNKITYCIYKAIDSKNKPLLYIDTIIDCAIYDSTQSSIHKYLKNDPYSSNKQGMVGFIPIIYNNNKLLMHTIQWNFNLNFNKCENDIIETYKNNNNNNFIEGVKNAFNIHEFSNILQIRL